MKIETLGQLKNVDCNNVDGAESMFILTNLEKMKETRLKFSQGSVTVLKIKATYQEAKIKLTYSKLNKLKSAAKNKTCKNMNNKYEKLSNWRIVTWIISDDNINS